MCDRFPVFRAIFSMLREEFFQVRSKGFISPVLTDDFFGRIQIRKIAVHAPKISQQEVLKCCLLH